MSAPMHELRPVDFNQVPTDFPQPGAELGGPAPYEVGIEGVEFGQDPVALLEPAAPSLASRVGDRMSQAAGAVGETAQAVGDTLRDPVFQKLALAAGEGALKGVGLARRAEDGSLQFNTGKALVAVRVANSLTPRGAAMVAAKAVWGGYQGVKEARKNIDQAYDQPPVGQ